MQRPPPARPHSLLCGLCYREGRGFGYRQPGAVSPVPHYRFCSKACLDAGSALAQRNRGMIDKTPLEARAIKEARRSLAETLTELGLMAPFHDRSADEIDRLIEACIDGFQAAMQRQAMVREPFDDDLPF